MANVEADGEKMGKKNDETDGKEKLGGEIQVPDSSATAPYPSPPDTGKQRWGVHEVSLDCAMNGNFMDRIGRFC